MAAVRISSSRSNYLRGGLLFAEPAAKRLADGRLAFDLARAEFMALGEAGARELAQDPAIRIEPLDRKWKPKPQAR